MNSKQIYDAITERYADEISELQRAVMLQEVENYRAEMISQLRVSVDEWITMVCKNFATNLQKLQEKSRKDEVRIPRQLIVWGLLKQVVNNSLGLSGSAAIFGQDHATAAHARRVINNRIETDPQFRERVMLLLNDMGWHTAWDPAKAKFSFYRVQKNVA